MLWTVFFSLLGLLPLVWTDKRILTNDPTFLQQNLDRLQTQVQSLQSSMTSLQNTVTTQNTEIQSLQNTVATQNTEIQSLTKQLSNTASDPSIAFMAIMDKDLVNASSNHIVIWNHVITNAGNAYSQHTGTFVAPVSGIYFFSMVISAPNAAGNHHMYVYLRKNGAVIGYLFFDNNATYWVKRTETVTVHLSKGDNVFIIILRGSGTHILAGQFHSNFSGFLVKAD